MLEDLAVAAEFRTALRAGRLRLHLVSLVRAGLWWVLPFASAALLLATLQRLGVLDIAWGWISIALGGAWAITAIVRGGDWTMSDADVALALDEGLGLDDRLCTALAAQESDGVMAARAIDQARQTVAGKVTRRTLSAAMPWQWPGSTPWSAGVILLAVFVAGTPASSALAHQARAQADVALAQAAELAQPLASHDEAIAEALADMQLPLPELETREAVELEALRRLTTLQTAIEALKSTDAQQAAANAVEALRALPARDTHAQDIEAIREALRRGDFKKAGNELNALAQSTRENKPQGDRKEAMEALAQDLEAAAERAEAMEQQRGAEEGSDAESSASDALEAMAQDLRECSEGECDKPSEACEEMSECSEAAQSAKQASEACAQAAGQCSQSTGGPGSGAQPASGGGQSPSPSQGDATANVSLQPQAPSDAAATIIDIQSVDGGPRDLSGVPVGPVPVGGASEVAEHRGPSPESLRRLPSRYQGAVRRFFGSGEPAAPAAVPPTDDAGDT